MKVDKADPNQQDRLLGMALDAASEDEAAAKDLVKFMKET